MIYWCPAFRTWSVKCFLDGQCVHRLETLIFKLEVLDHKARERAGVITPTLASPIPVLLQLDVATEVLCVLNSFFH